MGLYKYLVLSESLPGREDEFLAWYQDQHLPDVAKVPGVRSASRFVIDATLSAPISPSFTNLAIYEIEADDPLVVLAEIKRRAGTPEMPMTDALVRSSLIQVLVH